MQKSNGQSLHENNSTQDKENYRPVSILPIMSKLYERAINVKLMEFFETKFYTGPTFQLLDLDMDVRVHSGG